jgi:hypothetical protein
LGYGSRGNIERSQLIRDALDSIFRPGMRRLVGPATDAQRLPVRGTAQTVGQGRIVYTFRRHNAADAQGGKRKCPLSALRRIQVV